MADQSDDSDDLNIAERIDKASKVTRDRERVTMSVDVEIPNDLIDEVEEEYDHDDAPRRMAKAVVKRAFRERYNFIGAPELTAELRGAGIEPDTTKVRVVAISPA